MFHTHVVVVVDSLGPSASDDFGSACLDRFLHSVSLVVETWPARPLTNLFFRVLIGMGSRPQTLPSCCHKRPYQTRRISSRHESSRFGLAPCVFTHFSCNIIVFPTIVLFSLVYSYYFLEFTCALGFLNLLVPMSLKMHCILWPRAQRSLPVSISLIFPSVGMYQEPQRISGSDIFDSHEESNERLLGSKAAQGSVEWNV